MKDKLLAVVLYMYGLSLNSIAKLFHVSATAVLKWVHKFAQETYEKPKPGSAIVMEIDEMWHYLKEKPASPVYGRLIVVIPVNLWTGNVAVVMQRPSVD